MGIFDGILLCTDLDGTFLHEARASEENCRAIKYFQDNGGYFTVATGRSPVFVREFENYSPNAPLIVSNGTQICDHISGNTLRYFDMPEYTSEVLDELAALGMLKDVFLYDLHDGGTQIPLSDHRHWNVKMDTSPGEWFSHVPRPWVKMLLQQGTQEENAALKEYIDTRCPGMFETDRSYSIGLELHAPGSGKGPCVDILRRMLPDIRLVVGAGDYENDISLLEHADIGYAVDNALDCVKAAADRVTVPCTEHAIARIIADIKKEYGR